MKKYLVILVALLVISALIMSACSSPAPTTTAPAQTTAKPTTAAPTTAAPTTAFPTTAAPTTSAPPAAVKTIKFSYTMPKGASIGLGFEWFGPEFTKATNGRYKVEIYPASSLLPVPAAYDSIKSGAVQMAYTSTGTFPKQFPLTMVIQLPGVGYPQDTVKMFRAGNAAAWEFFNTTPEIKNEFKDITLLQPLVLDPYNLVAKKAIIKSPADFKGLKVGGTGGKMDIVTVNGGAKVQQVPPESYLNMDKGVVDASFITFSQVNDYKIYEIANFFSTVNFGNGNGIVIMNTEFFNSMGAADQKILLDTWDKAQDVCAQGSIAQNVAGAEAIKKIGKSIYVPTAAETTEWEKGAVPAKAAWEKDAKALNMTDAQLKMVYDKWLALRDKWMPLGK